MMLRYVLMVIVAAFILTAGTVSTQAEVVEAAVPVDTIPKTPTNRTTTANVMGRAHRHRQITGPTKGLHPRLITHLKRMSQHFGGKTVNITPQGGCRNKGSRAAPRSYHRRAVGCQAADVWIKGVRAQEIKRYCQRYIKGGCGSYSRRSFAHVDIGPERHWHWR